MAQELKDTSLYADANLVAYYRLESGALTTDSSAGGHTLTNTNTVGEGTGKFGVCADFSATNSNKDLRVTSDLGITGGAISISAWVKITTAPTSTNIACIAAQSDAGTNTEYYIRYYNNSGTLQLEFFRGKRGVGDNRVTVNHTLSTAGFTHVVLTYDATNIVGYINGVNVGTTAASGNGSSGSSDCFSIGEILGFNTWYLSGLVDDVAVFNRALTITEIQNLYDRGIKKINGVYMGSQEIASTALASDANCVGYWRFEDNLNDSTANSHNLTGSGTVAYTTGKFNKAYTQSNNKLNYAYINDGLGIDGGAMTMGCWFKDVGTENATSARGIMSQVNTNTKTRFGIARSTDATANKLEFSRDGVGGGGTAAYIQLDWSTYTSTTNFKFYVLTYDGTYVRAYVDGQLVGGPTAASGNGAGYAGSVTGFGVGIFQGWAGWDTTYNANGIYDDAFAFSRALTSDEIYSLYKTGVKKLNGQVNLNPELESTSLRGDANLVGYWRMEGNSLDETANNNDGTDTSITYGTAYGKFTQGASFGGSSKIVLPDVAGLNPASISVSFWLKSTQTSDYIHVFSNCLVGGSNYYGYYIGMMTDNIRFQLFYGDTTSSPLDGTRVVNDGVWHYITATFDGTTQKLFVDGTLDNSRASAAISYGGTAAPGIGAYIVGDSNKYVGSLDDLSILSRALTSTEISNLYNTNIKKYNQVSNV